MTNTQHTPGPWVVGGRYSNTKVEIADASYDRAICTVWTHQDEGSTVEFEKRFQPLPCGAANARLIAAAPELLAALEEFCRECDGYLDGNDGSPWGTLLKGRAAIAKATGQ